MKRKWKEIIVVLILVLFGGSLLASSDMIQKVRPSLKCDIYLSSDGKYYTQTEGFEMTGWYENTPEKAISSAEGALKRYYDDKYRTFKLIGSQTIKGN